MILVTGMLLPSCGSDDDPPAETLRVGNCPEIYASGFRNPWRWSFDRDTGDLWVGDVGQNQREEVDRVVLGGNYGWRCFEGTRATSLVCGSEPSLVPPIAEYRHDLTPVGKSVTGGYVYRGTTVMGLEGHYVFGDFIIGRIWNIPSTTPPTLLVTNGFDVNFNIASFGEDIDGELYVVRLSGQLYRLAGSLGALALQQVFTNITPGFVSPIAMLQAPRDNSRWFVVERAGRVRVFDNDPGETDAPAFLDIASRVVTVGEMGLLGMAFHPDFPTDPRVFFHYNPNSSVSRISEFRTDGGGMTLDPSSERILLTIRQPETNHNGGHLAFGPDGYLYIGMGDGGGGNDQHGLIGNGQLMTTLLGKMLRIDVNGAQPYAIPPTNPFTGFAPCGPNA